MLDKKQLKLVKRSMKGDKDAFIALCEAKARDILYICTHIIGNIPDGEDALQEILLYMYAHIHELKEAKAFQVWLYRITRSICTDIIRKRNKETPAYEERDVEKVEQRKEFLPYDFVDDKKKREELLEIINVLPEKTKLCVLLFYYESMSYEQISAALEISKKDVDNNLMKAKRLIRRKLNVEMTNQKSRMRLLGIVPIPVLTRILKIDAAEMMTSEIISYLNELIELLKADQIITAGTGLTGAAVWLNSSSGSGGIASGAGAASKITLGVVTTVSAAAIGTAVYQKQDIPVEEPAVAESHEEPVAEKIKEIEEVLVSYEEEVYEEHIVINTLEDMIGEEEAEQLNQYCRTETNRGEFISFIDEIEMEQVENIWQENLNQEDTLYILEKQDKILMLITRYNKESDLTEIAYRFMNQGEETIPRAIDIVFCFDEWKEAE